MCNCVICKKEYNKNSEEIISIRLYEDDFFCSRSYSVDVCSKCLEENATLTNKGDFLTINNKMYYCDCLGFSFRLIKCKEEIDYIFNKDYYDVLNKFNKTLC